MCGIIGYVGHRNASEVLIDGLRHLEYRGYDSVGVAVVTAATVAAASGKASRETTSKLEVRKDRGMIDEVSESLDLAGLKGQVGIGHTRWATHGVVCKKNAHPHQDCTGQIAIAHNGVLENFTLLKAKLAQKGHSFASDTDSELIAHLIEENLKNIGRPEAKKGGKGAAGQDDENGEKEDDEVNDVLEAFFATIRQLSGSYAIVAVATTKHGQHNPEANEQVLVARYHSPLVLGVGKGEMFCASDITAMLKYTKTFVALEEGDIAVLTKHGYEVYASNGSVVNRKQFTVDWDPEMAQKTGYPHYMLKEIIDQKHFINETLASDITAAKKLLLGYERIDIVACGTSYHAGLLLAYLLQAQGKSAQAYIASDYPFIAKPDEKTLVIAFSQSGETADVLQALRHAPKSKKLAITNSVGSTITTLVDEVVYLNTGPEIGVAATKTFTAQLAIAYKLAYPLGQLAGIPGIMEKLLEKENEIKVIAQKLAAKTDAFFIARGMNVPIAYEASLKFKEITYIHSEAYPGGELKHGTLSLISKGTPVIALAPNDETLAKLFGNIKEAKARDGFIISVTDSDEVSAESDRVIRLPPIENKLLYPFALIIPLQLLAYHVSILRGINPDRPRNLAKSVTVE